MLPTTPPPCTGATQIDLVDLDKRQRERRR